MQSQDRINLRFLFKRSDQKRCSGEAGSRNPITAYAKMFGDEAEKHNCNLDDKN